ncbi:MAG: polymerase [Nitrospiraceae bacterium]|nr:polymerase [Nitrospiraceae bacterium]
MPLKGILFFFGLFLLCAVGALFLPQLGVYGYIADYCIDPSSQWWAAPFSGLGIRYSLTLALATAIGILLQRDKLRFGEGFLQWQEVLILVFLGTVWLSVFAGGKTVGHYTIVDHPSVKFTKVVIFTFMMTHVITDKRKLDGLLWVFVIVSLILGLQAWDMPRRAFVHGRLEGIGGADFAESNFFAAFMAAMLPIIGMQLLRSKWFGKAVCAVSAAFTANTIVLCRSRGALVGIVAGAIIACLLAPKKHRKKIAVGLVLGIMGGIYVSDPQFLERATTITRSKEERDVSAASRLQLWQAGARIFADHPFGIGIGNWYQSIGYYIPEYEARDSHNTYVKCAVETGVQGILVYLLFIFTAFLQLWRVRKLSATMPRSVGDDLVLCSFGLTISLAVILTCALTITMIYTEIIWILLMLPVCLRRVLENAMADHEVTIGSETGESGTKMSAQSGENSDNQ